MPAARFERRFLAHFLLGLAFLLGLSDLRAEPVINRVIAVEGPGELRLADERAVLLANIVIPLEPARAETEAWLERLVGEAVEIDYLTTEPDRWERFPVVLHDGAGADIALQLVEAGLALVEPNVADNLKALLAAEEWARTSRSGFWSDGSYAIQPATMVASDPPTYAIVEGVVRSVGEGGYHAYLNFTDNWRTDFSARFVGSNLEDLLPGRSLQDLVGHTVRIRGWAFEANGPMIEIENASQLEVLPSTDADH